MSNISLGCNNGLTINLDGDVLQDQQEAGYRQDEEQMQDELRQMLNHAFEDIDIDDIVSVTSDDGTDSRNVSMLRRSNDNFSRLPTAHNGAVDVPETDSNWARHDLQSHAHHPLVQRHEQCLPALQNHGVPQPALQNHGVPQPTLQNHGVSQPALQNHGVPNGHLDGRQAFPRGAGNDDLHSNPSLGDSLDQLDSDYHSNADEGSKRDAYRPLYSGDNAQGQTEGHEQFVAGYADKGHDRNLGHAFNHHGYIGSFSSHQHRWGDMSDRPCSIPEREETEGGNIRNNGYESHSSTGSQGQIGYYKQGQGHTDGVSCGSEYQHGIHTSDQGFHQCIKRPDHYNMGGSQGKNEWFPNEVQQPNLNQNQRYPTDECRRESPVHSLRSLEPVTSPRSLEQGNSPRSLGSDKETQEQVEALKRNNDELMQKLRTAEDTIASLQSRYQTQVGTLQTQLEEERGQSHREKRDCQNLLDETVRSKERLSQLNQQLQQQLGDLERRQGDLTRQYDTLRSNTNKYESDIDSLRSELRSSREETQTLRNQYLTVNDELRSSREETQTLRNQYQTVNDELRSSREETQTLKNQYLTISGERESMREQEQRDWQQKLNSTVKQLQETLLKEKQMAVQKMKDTKEREMKEEIMKVTRGLSQEHLKEKDTLVSKLAHEKDMEMIAIQEKCENRIKTMKGMLDMEKSNYLEKMDKEKSDGTESLKKDLVKKLNQIEHLRNEKYNLERQQRIEIEKKSKEVQSMQTELTARLEKLDCEKRQELSTFQQKVDMLEREKEVALDEIKNGKVEKEETEHLRREVYETREAELKVELVTVKDKVISLQEKIKGMASEQEVEIDKVCKEKDEEIKNVEKRKQNEFDSLIKVKQLEIEQLRREKDEEIQRLSERLEGEDEEEDRPVHGMDRFNRELEDKLAVHKVAWLEEHRTTRQTAIENAVRLAEAELRLKMEEELEQRLDEAKVQWLNDSLSHLEDERRNWEVLKHEEMAVRLEQARDNWRRTDLRAELQSERQKLVQEFEQKLLENRTQWQTEKLGTVCLQEVEHLLQETSALWETDMEEPAKRKYHKEAEHELGIEGEKPDWLRDIREKIEIYKQLWLKHREETVRKEKTIWQRDVEKKLEDEKKRWLQDNNEKLEKQREMWLEEVNVKVEKEKEQWMKDQLQDQVYVRKEGELKKAKELLKCYHGEVTVHQTALQKVQQDADERERELRKVLLEADEGKRELQTRLERAVGDRELIQAELQRMKDETGAQSESIGAIYRKELDMYRQRYGEARARVKQLENHVQEMKQRYRVELEKQRKALEVENEVAMTAMKNKMLDLQKKHVLIVDKLRQKHLTEWSRDGGEEFNPTVEKLRLQYLDTVEKIKGDCLQHISKMKLRAAETIRAEVKSIISQINDNVKSVRENDKQVQGVDRIGDNLRSKLRTVEEVLDACFSSSQNNSPTTNTLDAAGKL